MRVNCIWQGDCILGEGPVWDHNAQFLYWVDIESARIHRLNTRNTQHDVWQMPEKVGAIALSNPGELIAALRSGLARVDLRTGSSQFIVQPLKDNLAVRFNDGKCDALGRFWGGFMDVAESNPMGGLFRFDQKGSAVTQVLDNITIANGLGWSPDNRYFYHTDSATRTISRYAFDLITGTLSAPHIFVRVPDTDGYPDGLAVDSEGYIWGAHWDGWRVTRYTPEGKVDRVIEMPVQRPTACCFGGPDLTTLYVTSARRDLDAAALAKGPLAGAVFAVETGVKGLPEPAFVLS